ncbi:hypothetical protein ACS0TY_035523 [Phlomoides rotata]
MSTEHRGNGVPDDIVVLEEDPQNCTTVASLCIVGHVLTRKSFNAFGFLETMKRAMNPSKGFTIKEIGPNLFSFKFRSVGDLLEIRKREPWHFEKNLLMLKTLETDEQPSKASFSSANFWIRIYDLPLSAISENNIRSIASRAGEVLEIDPLSLEGLSRSIRVRIRLDVTKPLKQGMTVARKNDSPVWVPFKYERLPSLCFFCGMLGHMKRECDLVEEGEHLLEVPDAKLPFGDWLRASPAKRPSVTTINQEPAREISPTRRRLFDNFRKCVLPNTPEVLKEDKSLSHAYGTDNTVEIEGIRKDMERVDVSDSTQEEIMETGEGTRISRRGEKNSETTLGKTDTQALLAAEHPLLTPLSALTKLCRNSTTISTFIAQSTSPLIPPTTTINDTYSPTPNPTQLNAEKLSLTPPTPTIRPLAHTAKPIPQHTNINAPTTAKPTSSQTPTTPAPHLTPTNTQSHANTHTTSLLTPKIELTTFTHPLTSPLLNTQTPNIPGKSQFKKPIIHRRKITTSRDTKPETYPPTAKKRKAKQGEDSMQVDKKGRYEATQWVKDNDTVLAAAVE